MSDVFLSYTRADADSAHVIATALERRGWSVWWDRQIPAGKTFDQVIEEQINAARCVVVLWSRSSTDSNWVKTEADEGLKRGILVPISIDGAEPPFAYRRIQAASLAGWSGDDNPEFAIVADAVKRAMGRVARGGQSTAMPRISMAGWSGVGSAPAIKRKAPIAVAVGVVGIAGIIGALVYNQLVLDGCDDLECRAQVAHLLDAGAESLTEDGYTEVEGGRWELEEHRLPDDNSVTYEIRFMSEFTYGVLAACDNGCEEMRVSVTGGNGLEVAAKSTDSSAALTGLETDDPALFSLQVSMNACRVQNCSYGLRLYSRPRS